METPIIKNNWISISAGLFGPQITYNICSIEKDAYLVISLILFKFIFKIKRNECEQDYYKKIEYYTYGFYPKSNPDKLVFEWGTNINKYWSMPWNLTVLKRSILNTRGKYISIKNDITILEEEIRSNLSNYLYYGDIFEVNFSYHVVKQTIAFEALKRFDAFRYTRYEVTVYFDNPINNCDKLIFETNSDKEIIGEIGERMLENYLNKE